MEPPSPGAEWNTHRVYYSIRTKGDVTACLCGFTTGSFQGSHYVDVQDFGPDEFDGTIGNLTPGKVYVFQIQARTQIGYGSVAHWEQLMPIWGRRIHWWNVCLNVYLQLLLDPALKCTQRKLVEVAPQSESSSEKTSSPTEMDRYFSLDPFKGNIEPPRLLLTP